MIVEFIFSTYNSSLVNIRAQLTIQSIDTPVSHKGYFRIIIPFKLFVGSSYCAS